MMIQTLEAIEMSMTNEAAAIAGADSVLLAGQESVTLSETFRIPRYPSGRRESNADHTTFGILALGALAGQYFDHVIPGDVVEYFAVHELGENITGDVPTFLLSDAEIAAKQQRDHDLAWTVMSGLPAYWRRRYYEYEAQEHPAARFAKLGDKLLPVAVDYLGQGSRVMQEDYGITDPYALALQYAKIGQRLRLQFPEPELVLLHDIRDRLCERSIGRFIVEHLAQESSAAAVTATIQPSTDRSCNSSAHQE